VFRIADAAAQKAAVHPVPGKRQRELGARKAKDRVVSAAVPKDLLRDLLQLRRSDSAALQTLDQHKNLLPRFGARRRSGAQAALREDVAQAIRLHGALGAEDDDVPRAQPGGLESGDIEEVEDRDLDPAHDGRKAMVRRVAGDQSKVGARLFETPQSVAVIRIEALP